MADDDFYLNINDLTEEQWLEIKQIAIQLHDNGHHQKNQLKCSIHAFVDWLRITSAFDLEDKEQWIN